MIAELATIAPVFALTIDVVGKAVPHGKAVRKVSAHGSTAVTETTTAVASAGTPLFPATGTVIIRDGPSLSGRSRVSAKRTGVGMRLTPPSAGGCVVAVGSGTSVPDHVSVVHLVGTTGI